MEESAHALSLFGIGLSVEGTTTAQPNSMNRQYKQWEMETNYDDQNSQIQLNQFIHSYVHIRTRQIKLVECMAIELETVKDVCEFFF